MKSPVLGPKVNRQFLFLKKKTRQKSVSSEPLIGHLAFVVGRLWPRNIFLAKSKDLDFCFKSK